MTSFAFILGVLPLAHRDRRRVGGAQLGRHDRGRRHARVDVPVDRLHSGALCRDSHDRARPQVARARRGEAGVEGCACRKPGAACQVLGAGAGCRCGAAVAAHAGVGAAAARPCRKIEFDEAVAPRAREQPDVGEAATAIAHGRRRCCAVARSLTLPIVSATVSSRDARLVARVRRRRDAAAEASSRSAATSACPCSPPIAGRASTRRAIRSTSRRSRSPKRASRSPMAAAQAYLAVIAAHRQVEVDERALESARAHLDYAGEAARRRRRQPAESACAPRRSSRPTRRCSRATRLALRRAQEALGVLVAADGPLDAGAEPVFDAPAAAIAEAQSRPRARTCSADGACAAPPSAS